jgi:hypothetical protein
MMREEFGKIMARYCGIFVAVLLLVGGFGMLSAVG